MTTLRPPPQALAFDVFGTVVDWHGGIAQEAAAIAARHGTTASTATGRPSPTPGALATRWRWTGCGAVNCRGRTSTRCTA
jgi:hypothetical protein